MLRDHDALAARADALARRRSSTEPRSGRSKPAMMFISVDLPQPDGPDDGDELAVADAEAHVRR